MIQIEERAVVSCKPLLLPSGITYGAYKPQERRKRLRPWGLYGWAGSGLYSRRHI